ncbi:MAG TPA: hypothetical protein PLI09_13440 [Candidatus Hydrogenedentes bacterium]|nr:hypothetical protein [Candidatus Hydrogenedentota bacterium]
MTTPSAYWMGSVSHKRMMKRTVPIIAIILAVLITVSGCGWMQSNTGKVKEMVRMLEKKAPDNPELLSAVYTLHNELNRVRKKKFHDNLKRDLETRGPEGRTRYEKQLKEVLGEDTYQELLRIRVKEGYADLFR